MGDVRVQRVESSSKCIGRAVANGEKIDNNNNNKTKTDTHTTRNKCFHVVGRGEDWWWKRIIFLGTNTVRSREQMRARNIIIIVCRPQTTYERKCKKI